jgi:hypothetical protein
MVKPIKAKPFKVFRKFLEDDEEQKEIESEEQDDKVPLEESNLISKGFALGQGNRHESTKRQLESLVSQIDGICSRAKREDELDEKVNILLDAISKLASAFRLQAELSKNNINVSIASNLLEDDLKAILLRKK